jgi:hypothetical protein
VLGSTRLSEERVLTHTLNSLRKKSLPAERVTSAAKADAEKQVGYRSGKPLRHPKSSAKPAFSAGCEALRHPKSSAKPAFSAGCEAQHHPKSRAT